MLQHPIRILLLAGSAAIAVLPLAVTLAKPSLLHTTRASETDLEITGLVEGLAQGQSAYIRRADLLKLPQTRAIVDDDPDYPGPPLHVAGVSFETLASAVHALPQSDLIDATCADRYRSHFPREYIAQHHPILVLTVDGQPLDRWAKAAHQYDPSPYVVMYRRFVPAFKVLSHTDRPQLPDNLVRIDFSTQAATFAPLEPHGNFAPSSPERIGFIIAKQNCLRCHFLGTSGGTKSGRSWRVLGQYASEEPKYFEAYVHNPKSIDPHANMEPQSDYDQPTLAALAAYFRTFSEEKPK